MVKKKAIREAMGEGLVDIGRENERIVVLDADLASSTKVSMFEKAHPNRFFQMGIAEQNMVGVAAGLATFGFIPFTSTFACFAAKRACDQIRIAVAQPKLNVKIIGAYAGLFTGKTGATHQSVQDMAIMRSMPNMVVVEPCDAVETRKMLESIIEYEGPVYFRATRDPLPLIFDEQYEFKLGKAVQVKKGKDAVIVAQGFTTHLALEAAQMIKENGIDVGVIHVPTLKPFDSNMICEAASAVDVVITVENHSIIGGLGSAVSEALSENCPTLLKRIGIRDSFGESGSNADLQKKYGLTHQDIINGITEVLEKKRCKK